VPHVYCVVCLPILVKIASFPLHITRDRLDGSSYIVIMHIYIHGLVFTTLECWKDKFHVVVLFL
jgi:hypothetical protein